MLDSATGARALAAIDATSTAVTVSLDTRFLKPARPGVLIARAGITEKSDRDIVVSAELSDEAGVVVASAVARLRILAKK
jgi:acyl-coenzyme A thioesterase PaaI-like protein